MPLAPLDSSGLAELESLSCGIVEVNVQKIAGTYVDSSVFEDPHWGLLWAYKYMAPGL